MWFLYYYTPKLKMTNVDKKKPPAITPSSHTIKNSVSDKHFDHNNVRVGAGIETRLLSRKSSKFLPKVPAFCGLCIVREPKLPSQKQYPQHP